MICRLTYKTIIANRGLISFPLILLFIFISLTLRAEGLLGIAGEEQTGVSVYIKDLRDGKVVLDYNGSRCMTPASVTKAFTSASAMCLLPSTFRFETKVYLVGHKGTEGEWIGNLMVQASGDPTLESEYFPNNQGFISKIINGLKNKGITTLKGDIILSRVDGSHQYAEGPIDTWCINDVPRVYGCGIFDFNWCDNYFSLYPATGRTTSPVPELNYTVWDKPADNGSDLIRGVYSDSLVVVGKNYKNNANAKVTTSMPYPFDTFRAKLIARLKDSDIEFVNEATDESGANSRELLVSHKSPQLDEILQSLMLRSDNMFAEGILRALGKSYGDRYASIAAETALWKSRGLSAEYNRILDGSGLSRADAISPKFLAGVLEWMARSDMAHRYISLFPVAGVSGTMKSFMADTRLKGRLAFKTGSLNAVQSYAGYVKDENGKATHVAVIMVNNFFCTRAELRQAISKLLLEIIE